MVHRALEDLYRCVEGTPAEAAVHEWARRWIEEARVGQHISWQEMEDAWSLGQLYAVVRESLHRELAHVLTAESGMFEWGSKDLHSGGVMVGLMVMALRARPRERAAATMDHIVERPQGVGWAPAEHVIASSGEVKRHEPSLSCCSSTNGESTMSE